MVGRREGMGEKGGCGGEVRVWGLVRKITLLNKHLQNEYLRCVNIVIG